MWSEPTACFASWRRCGTNGGAVGLWYGSWCSSWTKSGGRGNPPRPTRPINRNQADAAKRKPKPARDHGELHENPVEIREECRNIARIVGTPSPESPKFHRICTDTGNAL